MFPPLYHAHHLRRSDDLDFWLRLANRQRGSILELGCGTGRVLIPLVEAGYRVTGVDKDFDMLAYLRKHIPPDMEDRVSLVQADFTSLYIGDLYALILLPCNTYSTLAKEDRLKTLHTVQNHLMPDGLYAVSMPNPRLLAELPLKGELELEESFFHPDTGYSVEVISSWEREQDRLTFYYRYDHILPDGRIESIATSSTHFLDSLEDYLAQFSVAGLRMLSQYGDFEGSPYEDDSNYLILLAVQER